MSHSQVLNAISNYASAYEGLQVLQDTVPWIPGGDQKTGCIGEYYAFLYLLKHWGEDSLTYGRHTEKGWDIEISSDPTIRIQVKTVSAFSKTRTISPIHRGWDQLYVIYLSRRMSPEGFWIIDGENDIFNGRDKILGAKCPNPNSTQTSGSSWFQPFSNRVEELLQAISRAKNQT